MVRDYPRLENGLQAPSLTFPFLRVMLHLAEGDGCCLLIEAEPVAELS